MIVIQLSDPHIVAPGGLLYGRVDTAEFLARAGAEINRLEPLPAAFAADGYLPADGFLQYAIEDYPVRLVALDTLVPGEGGGLLCGERLAWLDQALASAPAGAVKQPFLLRTPQGDNSAAGFPCLLGA